MALADSVFHRHAGFDGHLTRRGSDASILR